MKFIIARSTLLDGLKKVQNIVPQKTVPRILENVLLEAENDKLVLTTTNLDISIRYTIPCEVQKAGASTLSVHFLFLVISKLTDGPVEIEIDPNNCARITSHRAMFKITGLPKSDFPVLPNKQDAFTYIIEQNKLYAMFRHVGHSVSKEEIRSTLKGVLMSFQNGILTMVATDGRRMALSENEVDFPTTENRDIVLPAKVVDELKRTLESNLDKVNIKIQTSQISFEIGELQFYAKYFTGSYPNYRMVIPENLEQRVMIDRQAFLNALERINVISVNEEIFVRLTFENNELLLAANESTSGSVCDSVPIKYNGEKIEIIFNPNYIIDPLRVIDDDEIAFEFTNGSNAVMIKCSVPFLYIIMPLRM